MTETERELLDTIAENLRHLLDENVAGLVHPDDAAALRLALSEARQEWLGNKDSHP